MPITTDLTSVLVMLTIAAALAKKIVEYRSALIKYQIDIAASTQITAISTAIQHMQKIKRDFVVIGGISMITSLVFSATMIFSHASSDVLTIGSAATLILIMYLMLISLTYFIIGTKST